MKQSTLYLSLSLIEVSGSVCFYRNLLMIIDIYTIPKDFYLAKLDDWLTDRCKDDWVWKRS